MSEELLAKVKAAGSPEELLKVFRENGVEDFSEENAKMYFEFIHKSGEVSDSEIENAIGGCKVNGHTVVTCDHKCHCGKWSSGKDGYYILRGDHYDIRNIWCFMASGLGEGTNKCGACFHLGFSGGTGYCEVD